MKAGGKFTLIHQMIWRLRLTPDKFKEMPKWSQKITIASLQLGLEEEEKKRNQGGES